jgi:hypothetical protein
MTVSRQSWCGRAGPLCHVLEELAQRARCSGAACLLAVDIVHGGVPAHVVSRLHLACHHCDAYIHMPAAKL